MPGFCKKDIFFLLKVWVKLIWLFLSYFRVPQINSSPKGKKKIAHFVFSLYHGRNPRKHNVALWSMILMLVQYNLSIFSLAAFVYDTVWKNSLSYPRPQRCTPVFPSNRLQAFILKFRPIIHFKLILLHSVR